MTYLYLIRIPVTGSFSRTAVNCASGVKTPLGGIYTGALVLLALGLLMPFCAYIPKASLAAVIITAVIFRFVRSCNQYTCLHCLCNVVVLMKAFYSRPTWITHSHVLLSVWNMKLFVQCGNLKRWTLFRPLPLSFAASSGPWNMGFSWAWAFKSSSFSIMQLGPVS